MKKINYWLMKSEPNAFGIDDLNPKTFWDGVRNYLARNYLKEMQIGDLAFFYHSNAKPSGIVGIVKIINEAKPDLTQFDENSDYFEQRATIEKPIWFGVEIELVEKFNIIPLAELKAVPELKDMALIKSSRLSVSPVKEEEWQRILEIKNGKFN